MGSCAPRSGSAARTIPTEPAWVLTTPPNYGPAIATGFITLYDAVRSALVDAGMLDPGPVSLREDIVPLFARLDDTQWVNEGYFRENGFGSGGEWLSERTLERLADPSRAAAEFRRSVLARFRDPAFLVSQQGAIPDMYGDAVSIPQTNPRQWLAVTPLQYAKLGAWARGRFTDDRTEAPRGPPGAFGSCRSPSSHGRSTGRRSSPAWAARSTPASRRRGRCAARLCGPGRSGCACARPRSTTASGAPSSPRRRCWRRTDR